MKFKKTLSGIIAGAMLVTGITFTPVSLAADGDPVARVDFDTSENYTLNGNASLIEGRDGNALSLDGTSGSYADVDAVGDALAKVEGDFTIGVWVNPSSITTWSRIYDFGNGSSGTYVFLTPSNGSSPRLAVTTNSIAGEQQLDSEQMLTTGIWHNITITRKDDTTIFYTDGVPTGTTASLDYKFSEIGKMQNYYLGKSQFDADPYFSGMIDDLVIYDYALDEKAVQDAAAEAYERIKKAAILENNCYVADTVFKDSDENELFAYEEKESLYITDKYAENGKAGYTVNNILASEDDFYDITAYAAQYGSDGTLKAVTPFSHKDVDWTEEVTDTRNVSFDYTPVSDAESVKLVVWDGMDPVSETPAGDSYITAEVTVENDTAAKGNASVALAAVLDDGSEIALAASDQAAIDSLDKNIFTLTARTSDIPDNVSKLIVRLTAAEGTYDAATLYAGITAPVAAPADSNTTTNGAHDPSIVKFPNDDTYYVYSSHHLIFTSKDLINWTKYDFTDIDAKDISPKTYSFISSNYSNTTMNGTYWAPDVIYKENDDHPYWAYLSLSCGLGGRNSAIALVKSDSPLFWADPNADNVDMGVVFATKENSSYKTNAIDTNIYTDTDGKQYFIWGSFWGGIQAASLKEDGFVEGIDYTSDATILSSCQNFGTSVFTQKSGVAGPEGAWMINSGDYRYMFTSYGWLGSNYNTRVARAPLSQKFSDNTGTQLTDANGVVMGTQYTAGGTTKDRITGYKMIGSYRLGDGTMTMSYDSSNGDYYYERSQGDAHVYYGPGHNSAITAPDGETFYVSHTRKDGVEGAATLQVRKMLFTADGWPVVSPVTYAGEKEQVLPEEMLLGEYDLASVGQTKMEGTQINTGTNSNRNYDLPVVSSKVTLNADGTMADGLGTWSFDGDHTVTLTFTDDGDTSKDEFYKNGDVMTMYALYGYDKDEKRPVIALTGTDQNHITQFATKPVSNTFKTPPKQIENTELVSIAKSAGGNPELGFDTDGNILYAGDPAATVVGDTVYLIAGHDTATDESYVMPEWVLYTSKNLTDWEYKGPVLKATDISWRSNDTSAWASQMTPYTNKETGETKYYLYFCTWDKTSSGAQSIGVAVADNPEGPYQDALGKPLISGSFTTPETSNYNDIDPTVLIDTDADGTEHRYLAWGNGKYYICELNEDMTSVKDIDGDGEIIMHKDVRERTIKSLPADNWYTEAPWLYKRDGKYYLFYAQNWREEMAYAMCDEPMGRYDFKQIIMAPSSTANTNHPSVIDFNGKTYFIYHNGALSKGSGFRRSVCIQELEFDENGYVYPLTETSIGLDGTASVIKTQNGEYVSHISFRNSSSDDSYPIETPVTVSGTESGYDTAWEIKPAKAVPDGENADYYVSIQSVNKPGLYIKAEDGGAVLTQDDDGKQGSAMTFKTVKGIDDESGVSFESVSKPGYYLTASDTGITVSSTGTNATFYIENATQKDTSVISPADPEPDPEAGDDVYNDFESASTGDVMTIGTADQGANTTLTGLNLYVGTRTGGGTTTTGHTIEASAGVDNSKAYVMKSGRWANSNRGPRFQPVTPPMPNGSTVTCEFSAKLGSEGELYWGDSTSTMGTNDLTGKLSTTDWTKIKVTIYNDSDTYTRTIYVNDEVISLDYVNTFPVFWGKVSDTTTDTYKTYIDNLSITTVEAAE